MVPISIVQPARAHYIVQLQSSLRTSSPVHVEPALRTADGSLALDGQLQLPFRPDLLPKSGGPSIMVGSVQRMHFEPWETEVAHSRIAIAPYFWDYVAVKLHGIPADATWEPVREWFLKWFDPEDQNSINAEGLYGVVHFMSDPKLTVAGAEITVDLGSAPAECFGSMISALLTLRPTLLEVA
jgi:hypothetical protein